MVSVNTQAVLLSRRNVSEADRLLTFYTREFGKLRLRASGLRKPTARLASMLEPFSHVEISLTLRQGQAIGRLINARLLFSGVALAHPVERFSAACLISEIANRFTAEADKNPEKFDLIQRAFERLLTENGKSFLGIACQFALQFLKLAGHGLHLAACRHCAASGFLTASQGMVVPSHGCSVQWLPDNHLTTTPLKTEGATIYLSPREGGLVCRKHRGEGASLAVSNEEIESLRELVERPLGEARTASGRPCLPAGRLLRLILFYLQDLLGESLSSAQMFMELATKRPPLGAEAQCRVGDVL